MLKPWVTGKNMAGGVSLRIQEHAACSVAVAFVFLLEYLQLGSGTHSHY